MNQKHFYKETKYSHKKTNNLLFEIKNLLKIQNTLIKKILETKR